jgi:LysR family nitrogen assimilation transcriptional regulator
MEFRQLRYFVRIVELGSFSRAAADLFIAQPALSQQIAHLESELGVRLLSRSVRGVAATEAGQMFYRHAQSVLRLMENMRSDVQRLGANPSGDVSIGMPTSVANILAAPLVTATQERHPTIRLQIVESLSGHLEELVVNGRIEMALLFDGQRPAVGSKKGAGFQPSHMQVRALLTEELFLLSAGQAEFDEPLTIAQAAELRYILPGRANTTRQIVEEAFASAGHTPEVIAELDSLATIKSLVADSIGATILSASAMGGASRAEGLTARRISDVSLTRRLSLCTYDIVARSAAAECVVELIESVSQGLVRDGKWFGASLTISAGATRA